MTEHPEIPKERDIQSLEEAENVSKTTVVQKLNAEVIDQVEAVLSMPEVLSMVTKSQRKTKKTWKEKIEAYQSPDNFLRLFQELGIQGDQWKRCNGLAKEFKLIRKDGTAKSLKGLYRAIKYRFEEYPKFVAWMEGKTEPDKTWIDKVEECQNPDDFLRLFKDVGIPGEQWKNSNWLQVKAKLPTAEGGMGQTFSGLYVALKIRFHGYPNFVAWMEGKTELEKTWGKKDVEKCQTREDFLRLFQEIGIPEEKWKSSSWLMQKAKLYGLYNALRKRFEEYPMFVTWMEGKAELDKTSVEKVKECQTREDFLRLFQEIGIPEERWRSCAWLVNKAKLPIQEGGIEKPLHGLYKALKDRFEEYPKFVIWMEGKTEPDKTWIDKVEECQSPDDFLKLFQEAGIPGDKWKDRIWLRSRAKLSIEKGGIGKTLDGLYKALKDRFEEYSKFVAWMEGRTEKTWGEKVDGCKTQEDFLKLFQEIGIPGDEWRSSSWLSIKAKLPIPEGGIGQTLCGLCVVLRKRFEEYPKFVAWMEGKDILAVNKEEVEKCQSKNDFLQLFHKYGIPEDKWRNGNWLKSQAKFPITEGGVGKNFERLHYTILKRYQKYSKFVAWMEGRQVPEIHSAEEAKEFIEMEAQRLNISVDELLNPTKITEYIKESPVLKEVLGYFSKNA